LHKKLPSLVNMKKETERNVSIIYDKIDKQYLKEVSRKNGKNTVCFSDFLPNSINAHYKRLES
jgi:hypothetical protein